MIIKRAIGNDFIYLNNIYYIKNNLILYLFYIMGKIISYNEKVFIFLL